MGGGRSNAPPPPAGGGKSRGPAGRGLTRCFLPSVPLLFVCEDLIQCQNCSKLACEPCTGVESVKFGYTVEFCRSK